MKRAAAISIALFLLGFGSWKLLHRDKGPQKPAFEESPLYSGKESKLKSRLYFPASLKPGFSQENADIYLTASRGAQIKQVLLHLFKGPHVSGSAAAFPVGFKYREVFSTEKGVAVIDLDAESVKTLPGGTSSEFVALYCLVRSVLDNFKDIKQVRILVGGELQESLAGHFDISGPLTLEDF